MFQGLLVILSECVHIFSYLSFSVCVSLSLFWGKVLKRWRFEKSVVIDLVGYGESERTDCRLLPAGWWLGLSSVFNRNAWMKTILPTKFPARLLGHQLLNMRT